MVLLFGDEGLLVDSVRRVSEVKLQEDFVDSIAVAMASLLCHLQSNLENKRKGKRRKGTHAGAMDGTSLQKIAANHQQRRRSRWKPDAEALASAENSAAHLLCCSLRTLHHCCSQCRIARGTRGLVGCSPYTTKH